MRIRIVGPCPKCGSLKTGYRTTRPANPDRIRIESFLKGERIDFFSLTEDRSRNCFCEVCHHKWQGRVEKKKLSKQEFRSYLKKHGFIDDRNEMSKTAKSSKKERKLSVKEKRIHRMDTILKTVTFLSGVDMRKMNPFKKKKEDDTG